MSLESRPPALLVTGPAVLVSGRMCAWMEHHVDLARVRVQRRGIDAEADEVLAAIRAAANAWRDAATGIVQRQEPAAPRPWFSTTQAADVLHLAPRTVRLACETGVLPARRVEGRWHISAEHLAHYRAARLDRAA